MSIAGTAEVLVRPDVSGFAGDLKDKIGSALKNPLVVAGAAVAAAGAAVGAFAASSINKFQAVGAEVKQLSALTGLSAEQTSKLRFAAEQTGVSTDALAVGIKKLGVNMEGHNKAFAAAGIAYTDAKGKLLPLDTTLGNVAAKFQSMPNGVAKNTLAVQLFGKSGTDLLPILNKGKDGLAQLEGEAQKYGLVLTQNNLDAIQKNIAAHRDFQAAMSGLQVQIGANLLPVITDLVTAFNSDAIPAIESLTALVSKDLGPAMQEVGKYISDFFQGFKDGTNTSDGLDATIQILGANVKSFVTDVFNTASIAVGAFIDGFKNSGAIGAEVGPVATIAAAVGAAVHDMGKALIDIINFLEAHPTVFKDTALAIGAIVTAYEGFKTTKKVIDFAVSGVKDVLGAISNITQGISGVAGKVINFGVSQTGEAAAKGAAQGAGSAAGSGAASNIAQNVVGGAAANALDLKAIGPKIKVFASGFMDALGSALETAAIGLLYVVEAIAGVIFTPEFLIGAAVIAVGALVIVFHKQILGFIEQIPGWIGDGIGALGDFGLFLIQKGVELFQGLVDGLESLALNFPSYLFDLIQAQAFALGFLGGLLVRAGIDLLGGLFAGAQAIWDASVHFFTDIPGLVLGFLGDLSHTLLAVGSALLRGLWDGIHTVWDNEVHFWFDIVPNVLAYLGDLSSTLFSKGLDLLHGLWHGIQDAWNDPIGFFRGVASAVSGFIGDLGSTLLQKGKDLIGGLQHGVTAIWGDVTSFFRGIGGAITGALPDMLGLLKQAGIDVLQGLLNGINAAKSKVTGAISQLGSDIKSGFTNALHIGSPSKDFHQFGVFIGQGLINGINEIAPQASNAVNGLIGVPKISGASYAGAGRVTHIENLHLYGNKSLDEQLAEVDRLTAPL